MSQPLSTADYALIVSICSAAVSLAGFVWTVWSKYIYPKGRVRVSFRTVVLAGDGPPPKAGWPQYVALSATNHGPTDVVLANASIVVKPDRPWRKGQYALVNPIPNIMMPHLPGQGPFAGGIPKALRVGEQHSVYFPFDGDAFGRMPLKRVGFFDNFSRSHWCAVSNIKSVKATLDKAFPGHPIRKW